MLRRKLNALISIVTLMVIIHFLMLRQKSSIAPEDHYYRMSRSNGTVTLKFEHQQIDSPTQGIGNSTQEQYALEAVLWVNYSQAQDVGLVSCPCTYFITSLSFCFMREPHF